MLGCLMLFPITGLFIVMGVYMSSLMAYFATLATFMGIYMGGLLAYFTAFFMWLLS
jgi:hypothetical protein